MKDCSIFDETIANMSWLEVEEAIKKKAALLIPVAVIEQHGPHLPIATDTYAAHLMCVLVKNELAKQHISSVIAPPYYFGINESTGMFPGSLGVSKDSMVSVLTDMLVSYMNMGFKRQFILNHHGDPQHNDALIQAILDARRKNIDAVFVMGGFPKHFIEEAYTSYFKKPIPLPLSAIIKAEESDRTKQARIKLMKSNINVHAEERETSLIMNWHPKLLKKKNEIKNLKAVNPTPKEFDAIQKGKWREISPLGYIGDPAVATKENGQLYAYESVDIAKAIAKFLKYRHSNRKNKIA